MSQNNDLISRSKLEGMHLFVSPGEKPDKETVGWNRAIDYVINNAPTVDAEVVRHEGNTTFVTTNNLDAYADRIIVRQGNWCKVYYRDSDDVEDGCGGA